jgi:hypothetical protein
MSQRRLRGRGENWLKVHSEYWSENSGLRVEDEKGIMNDDSFQRWLETSRQMRLRRTSHPDLNKTPFIRVSNDRFAREATFEDRLTLEDRQFLKEMGIRL